MVKYNVAEEDLWSFWTENKSSIVKKEEGELLYGAGTITRPYFCIYLVAENFFEPKIVLKDATGDIIDSTIISERNAEDEMQNFTLQALELMNSGYEQDISTVMFRCDNPKCKGAEARMSYPYDDNEDDQRCPICKRIMVPEDIYEASLL